MPIEIKELHIRVSVNTSPSGQPATASESSSGGESGGDKEAIVAECVEQVLHILQNMKER